MNICIFLFVLSALARAAAQTCPCFIKRWENATTADIRAIKGDENGITHYSVSGILHNNLLRVSASCADANDEEEAVCQEELDLLLSQMVEYEPFPEAGIADTCPCVFYDSFDRTSFEFQISIHDTSIRGMDRLYAVPKEKCVARFLASVISAAFAT